MVFSGWWSVDSQYTLQSIRVMNYNQSGVCGVEVSGLSQLCRETHKSKLAKVDGLWKEAHKRAEPHYTRLWFEALIYLKNIKCKLQRTCIPGSKLLRNF